MGGCESHCENEKKNSPGGGVRLGGCEPRVIAVIVKMPKKVVGGGLVGGGCESRVIVEVIVKMPKNVRRRE